MVYFALWPAAPHLLLVTERRKSVSVLVYRGITDRAFQSR